MVSDLADNSHGLRSSSFQADPEQNYDREDLNQAEFPNGNPILLVPRLNDCLGLGLASGLLEKEGLGERAQLLEVLRRLGSPVALGDQHLEIFLSARPKPTAEWQEGRLRHPASTRARRNNSCATESRQAG